MLKVRIIPTLLWKDFGLVKGIGFNSWRRIGSVLPALKVFNTRDVDELVLLDITATLNQTVPDIHSIEEFSQECSVPLTVGGGISNLDQIKSLLYSGADKIIINSAAYENPNLIEKAASRFGSQCVVCSIDVKNNNDGTYSCWSHSGSMQTKKNPIQWVRQLVDLGAGEILLTSIDRDGTMEGYDLDLIRKITSLVDIPVIASGGAGSYQDMIDVIRISGASAIAASSMFQFTEQTPAGAKKAMKEAGIAVRNNYIPEQL
jgi:imidazole glycerol-phosphate synthase subunit HisF